MIFRYQFSGLISVVVLLLIGCQSRTQISPLHSPLLSSPLEPVSVSEPILMSLPQPAPGTGIVVGVIKVEYTAQPMAGVDLYLARHIGATPDTPMYSLEPDSAPHTIVEDNGLFIFRDVPPGRYAIVVWNPLNSFLVRDPTTGSELVIDVQPDRIYNVGTLFGPHP